MTPELRYLTEDERSSLINDWAWRKAKGFDQVRDGIARQWADPGIINVCDRINEMSQHIVTSQSCEGHRRDDGYVEAGVIRLRYSRSFGKAAYRFASELASSDHIDAASFGFYSHGKQEFLDIIFRGMSESEESLDLSLAVIMTWIDVVHSNMD